MAMRGSRIYAEDPAAGFLPSTGKLECVEFPDQVRVDAGVESGDEISPFYDPMIAKLIAHGETREAALDRLRDALLKTVIAGPKTNNAFLLALCDNEIFRNGEFDTGLIDNNMDNLVQEQEVDARLEAAGIVALVRKEQSRITAKHRDSSPWSLNDAYSNGQSRQQSYKFVLNGKESNCIIEFDADKIQVLDSDRISIDPLSDHDLVDAGSQIFVLKHGQQLKLEPYIANARTSENSNSDGIVRIPMHGKITSVSVADGDEVEAGDLLFAVEAMKMEHAVISPIAGKLPTVLLWLVSK